MRALMSGRRWQIAFTNEARQDYQEILVYSLEMWGADQLDRYEATLDYAIRRMREFPDAGRDCTQLMIGGRCVRAGHHMIYYTVSNDTITIHRILHERRHVTSSLMEPLEPEE